MIQPYTTNELYKFQAKKLGAGVTWKIWDTSHSESSPNVDDTLTAKNNYEFPYITVFTRSGYTQPATEIDNYRIRKYTSPEPTAQLGAEESPVPTYTPPNPVNLQNTTGNFWVNYTWAAGSGNVTNGYNVSWNSTWDNTSNTYMNKSVGASNWANITVWAWNSSDTGTISTGSVSDQIKTSAAADTSFTVTLPIGYAYAHFNLTGIVGGRAHDTSGNANDGTIYGATQTDGKYGDALDFDGTNDYITVADSASLDLITNGSILASFRCDTQGGAEAIINKGGYTSNKYNQYLLGWRWGAATYIEISLGNGSTYQNLLTGSPLNTGQYYQIVATWDGGDLKIYVDGEISNSVSQTITPWDDGNYLLFGSLNPSAYYLDGTIDDVRIYNRALNLTEIQNNYNNSITRNGLVGEWTFDHGPSTQTNVTPAGQNPTTAFYNVTNTGNVNLDVRMKLNTTITNVILRADTDNNPTGAKEVNTTLVTIHSGLTQSNSIDIWIWSDFNHTIEQATNRTLDMNVTQ